MQIGMGYAARMNLLSSDSTRAVARRLARTSRALLLDEAPEGFG